MTDITYRGIVSITTPDRPWVAVLRDPNTKNGYRTEPVVAWAVVITNDGTPRVEGIIAPRTPGDSGTEQAERDGSHLLCYLPADDVEDQRAHLSRLASA